MRQSLDYLITEYQRNCFLAALSVLKNVDDANDAAQDAFMEYYLSEKEFENEEHIKAWLLRVTVNKAKDMARSFFRRNMVPLEQMEDEVEFKNPQEEWLFDEVMKLPEKYRIVIHLFYYEELAVKDISGMLAISEANVKKRLSRGRKLLGSMLEKG